MEVKIVDSYEEIDQNTGAWDAINEASPTVLHPFIDPEIVSAYARHFIPESQLRLVVCRGSGNTVVLPFYRKGRLLRSCGLIGDVFFDYTDMLGLTPQPDEFTQMLNAAGTCVFRFMRVREDSAVFKLVSNQSGLPGQYSAVIEESVQAPYIDLKGLTWAAVYKSLSKNTKSDLRRKSNRLKDYGEVEFGIAQTWQEVNALLPEFTRQHISRREDLGQAQSVFADEQFVKFFNDSLEQLCNQKKIYLFYLNVDGRPVAFSLSFLYRNRMYYYMATFDASYHKSSPGTILLTRMIEYLCDQGIEELDFMIGEEDYKSKYGKNVRKSFNVFLYKRTLSGRLGYWVFLMEAMMRKLKEKAVNSPLKPLRRMLLKSWYRLKSQ